ncbi:MAG: class I SAM-dependent methyltransferase [Selenomonadaceae bacterium]|nr:class I SAM-dependent methyltransferase [Selenomonadaceae bacterium]
MDDRQTLDEEERRGLEIVREKLGAVLESNNYPQYLRGTIDEMMSAERMTFDLMGFKHGTDKASVMIKNGRLILAHDYLRQYELFFAPFRYDEFSLIEFGCWKGESLRLWKEYFPRAQIYGVDIMKSTLDYAEERISVVLGDATRFETFSTFKQMLNGVRPSVIIDDASHAWGDQRRSFELFWRMLAPGGLYIVEDLECGAEGAYPDWPPEVLDSRPFFNYIQDMCMLLRWSQTSRAFLSKDSAFNQLPELTRKIMITLDACYFVPGAVIMRKNPLPPPWEVER